MITLIVTCYLVFLLALISPGPDFIVVLKNTLQYPRKIGIATSLGVALGFGVHVAYSLVGIGVIISQSILLFNVIKYIGALYLLYLAYKLFRAKSDKEIVVEASLKKEKTLLGAFGEGFLTNVLNPKATLFFVSLFSQLIGYHYFSIQLQIVFGVSLILIGFIYFSAITFVFQYPKVKQVFEKSQNIINKIFGGLLAFIGIKIMLSNS